MKHALSSFRNKFYSTLTLSKLIYLDKYTALQYVSVENKLLFLSLFDKFLDVISWDSKLLTLLSDNNVNNSVVLEDLMSDDILVSNGILAQTLFDANKAISMDVFGYGAITNFVFHMYSLTAYNNSILINDSNPAFFTFLRLYNFYNMDMFKTSFLFFENVRHSTKLEII